MQQPTDFPDPLTPADCNLRGLPYMPLQVIQLLDSDLFIKSTGDEFKAAVALWCKSWNQLPGGSLPDDDVVLASLSGAKNWKKVKDMAMRGWFLCKDGRFYHKTVAENVVRAWESREDFQEKQDNKETRQERWRARVKQLTEQLRAIGVTPPAGAGLKALETLLERSLKNRNVDGNVDASVDAHVDGETSTGNKSEMSYKRREEKRELTTATSSSGDDVRRCPTGTLVNLYHELMPNNPRVKVVTATRKAAIRSRWNEAAALSAQPFGYKTKGQGLEAWKQFFAVCAQSNFLIGKAPAQPGKPPFIADIDFIFSPGGFAKILENKYHRDAG
jgi:uncharacterized protein YdaU (DUF1376 family)